MRLIQINLRGEVINVIGSSDEIAIPERVKFQLMAKTKDGGLRIAQRLIEKPANSIDTLRQAFHRSRAVDKARCAQVRSFDNVSVCLWRVRQQS